MALGPHQKIAAAIAGIGAALAATAILLFLGRLQQVFLLDRLFWETPPFGWAVIIAIFVFGGFYLLHAGFEILYSVSR